MFPRRIHDSFNTREWFGCSEPIGRLSGTMVIVAGDELVMTVIGKELQGF